MLGKGQSIPYSMALSRSFKVWWRGLGVGLPFINFLTLIHAETDLTSESVTSWDREGGFTVEHEKISILRLVVATICLVVFFTLGALGTLSVVAQ